MGTEYYLVKPDKKETFYLGKHMSCPEGIVDASRSWKSESVNDCANYIDYDCWGDFFWDFLKENEYCFDDSTLAQAKEIIYEVYNWCLSDRVCFDHDCHDNVEWLDWKETGSLIDLFEKINNTIEGEK